MASPANAKPGVTYRDPIKIKPGVPYPRVEVEWIDATSQADSWDKIEVAVADRPHPVTTVGLLLSKTARKLTIGLSVSGDECNQWKIIPRGWVERFEYLVPASGGSGTGSTTKKSRKAGAPPSTVTPAIPNTDG